MLYVLVENLPLEQMVIQIGQKRLWRNAWRSSRVTILLCLHKVKRDVSKRRRKSEEAASQGLANPQMDDLEWSMESEWEPAQRRILWEGTERVIHDHNGEAMRLKRCTVESKDTESAGNSWGRVHTPATDRLVWLLTICSKRLEKVERNCSEGKRGSRPSKFNWTFYHIGTAWRGSATLEKKRGSSATQKWRRQHPRIGAGHHLRSIRNKSWRWHTVCQWPDISVRRKQQRLLRRLFFTGQHFTREYCKNCRECQLIQKKGGVRAPLLSLPIMGEPFQCIATDSWTTSKIQQGHRSSVTTPHVIQELFHWKFSLPQWWNTPRQCFLQSTLCALYSALQMSSGSHTFN